MSAIKFKPEDFAGCDWERGKGHAKMAADAANAAVLKPWYEIYRDRMNETYAKHFRTKYAPFLNELAGMASREYLELGCGAGWATRFLRRLLPEFVYSLKFTLVDSCPQMLSLAVENNPEPECAFLCRDLKEMPATFGNVVVHSHGVLEHFTDSEIQLVLLKNRFSRQVHYVPSAKYVQPSRGDERLMTPAEWEEILQGCGVNMGSAHVKEFNDGLDLMIVVDPAA